MFGKSRFYFLVLIYYYDKNTAQIALAGVQCILGIVHSLLSTIYLFTLSCTWHLQEREKGDY